MPIEHFVWTDHAEIRLSERGLTHSDVEHAIRNGHDTRQVNDGPAEWRTHGKTPDGQSFVVIYDSPVHDDSDAA